MRAHRLLKIPMSAPDDTAAIASALEMDGVELGRVASIMCMTEGDGLARAFASFAIANLFHVRLGWDVAQVPRRIPLIMIGGCSGLVSPYAAIFVTEPSFDGPGEDSGLVFGVTTTPDIDIEDFGTMAMVDIVSAGVRDAISDAGLLPGDVHNVQIKAPWPTTPALVQAHRDGKKVATQDGNHAGALARAAGALGVAIALGELDRAAVTDADIGSNLGMYSSIASASAGTERTNVAIIVAGNSQGSRSPYRIGHSVMHDGIDVAAVYQALQSAGVSAESPLLPGETNPVDHVFVKSAVDLGSECRGRRHAMQTDYLAPYSWLIGKAVIHATVAAVVGDPMMQVSGGGEHQGPPGGGLVAVIARKQTT